MMNHIQAANNIRTYFLKEYGYNGSAFKTDINILTNNKKTTVPENRDRIEILTEATSHKAILHATGGGHLTSDDKFRSAQIS